MSSRVQREFTPRGVCASRMTVTIEADTLVEVSFTQGCTGNGRGLAALLRGMPVAEAADRLRGITCRNGTSCPDQLSRFLETLPTSAA